MTAPPLDLPGLDPSWSRRIEVTDADGVRHGWHVLDNGVGDPVGTLLCVHGNPTWSYLWRGLLAAAPPGWRVLAPDQLGMGYSDRPGAPRTLVQRVADLDTLTTAMGVRGPVVTVGHDWGGVISLGWALAHSAQLRGVVLLNTAVAQPVGDTGPALIRLANLPGVRELVCVGTPAFLRATTALSHPPLPRAVRTALSGPYGSAARRRSVGDFVADIPFSAAHPSRPAQEVIAAGIGALEVPALLLWGPRDPVFGEKYLADLRTRLPRAQLHRYEGASHLVTEDAPQYAEAVAQWIRDLQAPPVAEPLPTPATSRRLWSALQERAVDDTTAVVEVGGGTVSWAQLARQVHELSAGLAATGVGPGDRVGLLLPPSADLTAVVYAVWRAGAVIVVADKGLGLRGMRRALRSAAVDHVVGGAQGLTAARLMRLPGTRIPRRGLPRLRALGRRSPAPAEPSGEQDCAVVFTSGATGPAKGVVYRHRQVLTQLELLRTTYGLDRDDRLVAAFAPFALLGPALGIASVVPDIDVTAPGTLTATKLAEAAAALGATVVFASPAALRRVASTAGDLTVAQRATLGRIRLLMSAGAPVPSALLDSLRMILPAAEAHTPYGMTEALPVTDVSAAQIEAAGAGDGVCVGHPLPGVQVAVSPLSPMGVPEGPLCGEPERTGEVCVRAAHVKDRYDALWATQRASAAEPGWHRTGDVGHLDPQGRLWIEGRLPHVVTTPTGVLTPVGVEQRIEGLAAVAAAAVVGVGPAGTQVVVVVVVPAAPRRALRPRRAGLSPAGTDLVDAVRAVAGVPVAVVLVTARLPVDVRHASKVDRSELARAAARVLAGARP